MEAYYIYGSMYLMDIYYIAQAQDGVSPQEAGILFWTSAVAIVGLWLYSCHPFASQVECQTKEFNIQPAHPSEWATQPKY